LWPWLPALAPRLPPAAAFPPSSSSTGGSCVCMCPNDCPHRETAPACDATNVAILIFKTVKPKLNIFTIKKQTCLMQARAVP
jgi:hypothetical protein